MAEALLGAFLGVLFDRLASPELLSFARRKNLIAELNKLKIALHDIKDVLADAENKDMSGETAASSETDVGSWLDDLRDFAYEADDLLDEFAIDEALRAAPANRSGNLHLPGCCPSFLDPRRIKFNSEMTSKMKMINARLDEIRSRKNSLGLKEGEGRNVRRNDDHQNLRTTTSLPESRIFGRKKEKEDVLKLVMDETQELSVIPILGMGGSGKTTLAQSIFNDEAVKKSFDKKAWACVSVEFNMVGITRPIVQQVGGDVRDKKDLNELQVELQRCLAGKKFLIVLDDVWSEDYDRWTQLQKPFGSSGLKGSKIIVTTRIQTVAGMMKSSHVTEYLLGNLSESDSWALLAHHALDADNFDEYPDLKPEAEKILNKCGGLPLATKSLGGLLRPSKEQSFWKGIADSEIWDRTSSIPNALNLSYVYLPSCLKRCFVYCAVFPKDYEFDMDHLISLWMAEGLLKKPNVLGKSTRDVGLEYFQQLSARSFFQSSTRGKSIFLMHDLMNDLATSKACQSCLNLEDGLLTSIKESVCSKKVRHLSLFPQQFELSSRFEGFHDFGGLRTFLALDSDVYQSAVSDKVVEDAFRHQKRLRVLSLYGYGINEVPDYIGRLRHLRYLNLSRSNIQYLPMSMSVLFNLETLILRDCEKLLELPGWITKLINLRCIDVRGTECLRKMPGGLGDLVKLEILPKFIVGGDNGAKLEELKDMMFLTEELGIEGLSSVVKFVDARHVALNAKTRLTCLNLSWQLDEDSGRPTDADAESQKHVLDLLQPHARIKKLGVEGYGGTEFPYWMGDASFVCLEQVTLCNCRNIDTLPMLGSLPALKEVIVERMDLMSAVGAEFYGNIIKPFQCLESLAFDGMYSWKQWSFSVIEEQEQIQFPRLRKLKLRDCPNLNVERWPDQFPALLELVIEKCPLLRTPIAATSVPALESAKFGDCDGRILGDVISIRSLKSLKLVNMERISPVSISLMRDSSLTSLKIEECEDLILLWEEEEDIKGGGIIESSSINSLSLEIRRCNKLVKIGAFPPNLSELRLEHCENLEELPERMPSSLRLFQMQKCEKVKRLPKGIMVKSSAHGMECYPSASPLLPELEELRLWDCPSLTQLRSDETIFVPSLKILHIHNSVVEDESKRSIISTPQFHTNFTQLTHLSLRRLPTLELECFPQLPGCLRELTIIKCPGIKSLPQGMHAHLSLQSLIVYDCTGITSFPEQGLPPNLEDLALGYCENLRQPMSKWGFHRTTALKELYIIGKIGCLEGVDTFPPPPLLGSSSENGHIIGGWPLLPPSLTELSIGEHENLVSLSSGMHTHLTHLKRLYITDCPKLQWLPRKGFPASLCRLRISRANGEMRRRLSNPKEAGGGKCGGLGRGRGDSGCYFPLIQHIPSVDIE